MKKIILTAVVLVGVLSTYAQTNSNNEPVNNAAANKNTIIIDGKKFPMTAAEYEAQRNVNVKQAVQPATPAVKPSGITTSSSTGTLVNAKPVLDQPKQLTIEEKQALLKSGQLDMEKRAKELQVKAEQSNKVVPSTIQETKPVYELPKTAPGSIVSASTNKMVSSTDPSIKQSPANNVRVVDNTRVTEIDDAKAKNWTPSQPKTVVTDNNLKPVAVSNNTAPTTATIIPTGLMVATGSNAATVVTPASTMPQVQLNQQSQKMEEVPASANNVAPKVPAVPMQTEKAKSKN
jgi:hypothetical protein